jgi:hypothetical protein
VKTGVIITQLLLLHKTVFYTRGNAGTSNPDMTPEHLAALREQEQRRAAELLGVQTATFLDGYSDGEVEATLPLRRDIALIYARFITILTYKAELVGITVKVTEESYTSKASLLDMDPLPVRNNGDGKHTFSGRHVKRGLYHASDGRKINADINGAGNIIRKVAPDAFRLRAVEDGKEVLASLVIHPVRIVVPLTKLKNKQIVAKVSGQENALFCYKTLCFLELLQG